MFRAQPAVPPPPRPYCSRPGLTWSPLSPAVCFLNNLTCAHDTQGQCDVWREARCPPPPAPVLRVPAAEPTCASGFLRLPDITCPHSAVLWGTGPYFSVSRGGRRPRRAAVRPLVTFPSRAVCTVPSCTGFCSQAPRVAVGRFLEGETLRRKGRACLGFESSCQTIFLRSPASVSSCQQGGRASASSPPAAGAHVTSAPGWWLEGAPPAPAAHGASIGSRNGGSRPVPLWSVLRVAEVFPAFLRGVCLADTLRFSGDKVTGVFSYGFGVFCSSVQ